MSDMIRKFFPGFRKKIALALGGGAARGLASIGVLKVLETVYGAGKLPFDMIVGTSIGSMIGAAYSAGIPVADIEKKALEFNWPSMLDFGFGRTGLLKGERFQAIIHDLIGGKRFEDLKIPFALTTTDIESGEELVHASGDLTKLVRASCSWPGFFASVEVDGRLLADGGIRNTIPTKAARKLGADLIVAVDPGFAVKKQKIDNAVKALVQSFQIMGEELNTYQARAADIVIKPFLENIDQFDFSQTEFIIQQGEIAASRRVDDILRKVPKR
jgi:NTE family protein